MPRSQSSLNSSFMIIICDIVLISWELEKIPKMVSFAVDASERVFDTKLKLNLTHVFRKTHAIRSQIIICDVHMEIHCLFYLQFSNSNILYHI